MLWFGRGDRELPVVEDFETLFGAHALEQWACLGAITERSVRVWLRHAPAGTYAASLSVGGTVVSVADIVTDDRHDCIGVADLEAPEAMAGREFAVTVAGIERRGRFAPAAAPDGSFTFLFGSCNQPYERRGEEAVPSATGEIYGPMLRTAQEAGARFSLLAGDQAYADGISGLSVPEWARTYPDVPDARLRALYQQVYRAYFGHPGFQALLEAMPSYLVWDDHEIFDCWGSHEVLEAIDRRLFEHATAAYVEYQHSHNPGGSLEAERPFDYSFWYGGAGFFVFDLRSERDYRTGSLVGAGQWERFAGFLAEAAERAVSTVFVVTTIPVVHFSPRGIRMLDSLPGRKASLMRERWDSEAFLPHRERLLTNLFDWQSAGEGRKVILLSGDVHAAGAFRVHRKHGRGVITQWTSSAMSTPGGPEHMFANRLGSRLVNVGETMCRSERIDVEPLNNFGLVSVSPDGDELDVRLSIYKFDARKQALALSFTDRATSS